jgi:hypothetical protein
MELYFLDNPISATEANPSQETRTEILILMKTILTFLIAILFIGSASGATITAVSANQPDVLAAYNAAAAGDTIVIPAGTATWTNGIGISKSVTIQGAGIGQTILKRPAGTPPLWSGAFFSIGSLPSDVPVRITGIEFDSTIYTQTYTTIIIYIQHRTTGGASFDYTQIRIDHCKFNRGKRQIWWEGRVFGVVDHCTLVDHGESGIHVRGDGDADFARAKSQGIVFGTLRAVFIEDCNFIFDANAPVGIGLGGSTDSDYAGVSVWRHNTFDYTAFADTSADGPFDFHGNLGYWSQGGDFNFTGTLQTEIYNNTIKLWHPYRAMYIRAGRMIVANNTYTSINGSSYAMVSMTEEEANGTGNVCSPGRTVWPAEENINNSFFFGNTMNGQPQQAGNFVCWDSPSATFIQVNRDYWLKAPDSTTVTNYPNPSSPPSAANYPFGVIGAQSPCGPVTSWTPAAYPHPLVTGGATGTQTMHVVGQVTFPSGEQVTLDTTATKQ